MLYPGFLPSTLDTPLLREQAGLCNRVDDRRHHGPLRPIIPSPSFVSSFPFLLPSGLSSGSGTSVRKRPCASDGTDTALSGALAASAHVPTSTHQRANTREPTKTDHPLATGCNRLFFQVPSGAIHSPMKPQLQPSTVATPRTATESPSRDWLQSRWVAVFLRFMQPVMQTLIIAGVLGPVDRF
jgi:hypothetical protein